MTILNYKDNTVNLSISKSESVNLIMAKILVRKTRRVIEQNTATSLVVKLYYSSIVDERVLIFFNRILCRSDNFPVTIQYH